MQPHQVAPEVGVEWALVDPVKGRVKVHSGPWGLHSLHFSCSVRPSSTFYIAGESRTSLARRWMPGSGFFIKESRCAAGGAMGYIKGKSKKSAMAGSISGSVMLIAAVLMRSPGTLTLGFYLACGAHHCAFAHVTSIEWMCR